MRHGGHLLRVLGIGFALAGIFGAMVGQGILRSPGVVAAAVHEPWLMMALWVFGALAAALSALPYAELGSALPGAGGPYDYIRRAYGETAGVFAGWSVFLGLVTTIGMLAYVTGEFIVRLGVLPTSNPALPGLAVLALFYAINAIGTRFSGASQMAFSTIKGLALIAFTIAMSAWRSGEPALPAAPIAGPVGVLGIALALRVIIGTYNGWQDLVLFGAEIERPDRSLPRALFGGIAMVTALYLLVNLALLNVLTPAQMAGSNLAAADAAGLVFGARGDFLLTLFGVISVGAITNLGMMATARISYALARDRILPRVLADVSDSGSPRWSLTVITLLSAGFVATGTFDSLSAGSTVLYQLNIILVTVAAIGLRRSEPDMPRPFRVRWFTPAMTLSLILNLAMLAAFAAEGPAGAILGFVMLGAAFAISLAVARLRPSPTIAAGDA